MSSTSAAPQGSAGRISASQDIALLILRIILGIVFIAHGSQKLFGAFNGPGLANWVHMMGPVGYLVAIGEFFGGLGILVGFLTRFSAAAIIVIMLGAISMVSGRNGFFMNWSGHQPGEGYEYHLLVISICIALILHGPGRLAIGRLLPRPNKALE